MITENDPFYIALNQIDIHFHRRWLNHAGVIDFINESNDYSFDTLLQNMLKRSVVAKIIELGFAQENLTEEDISYFFLKYYSPKYDKATEICKNVHNTFAGKFIFNLEQVHTLIDLVFFISDHVTKKNFQIILKLIKSLSNKKQELYKYHCMAYVKETFERLGIKTYSKAYNFLDIPKRTWEDWKERTVRNKKNIDRFNEWKSNTPPFAIEELTSILKNYKFHPEKNINFLTKTPSCFIRLSETYQK